MAPAVRQTGIRRLALRRPDYREPGFAGYDQAAAAFEVIRQDRHGSGNETRGSDYAGSRAKIDARSRSGGADKSRGKESRQETAPQSGSKSDSETKRAHSEPKRSEE